MRLSSLSRRQFLRLGAVSLASAGLLTACGAQKKEMSIQSTPSKAAKSKELKILQMTHFVPAYDEWFDKDFTQKWARENGMTVVVDHVGSGDIYARAAAEAASRTGHDLVGFVSPPAVFEKELVDMAGVVKTLESKLGAMEKFIKPYLYNPKTEKWFAVSDHWVPAPPHYRKDLWEAVEPGSNPSTYEEVLRIGKKLMVQKYPIGIGFSPEMDSNTTLRGILYSYGGSEQDENGKIVINSPQTITALKLAATLYKETMGAEVFSWSASSNNQFMLGGKSSLVFNAISVLRTAEKNNPNLAKEILIARMPAGPVRRVAPINVISQYGIWQFSPNIEEAKKLIVDLITNYATAFAKSEMYNLPSFPGTVPNIKDLLAKDPSSNPPGKYSVLGTAQEWTTNSGFPGTANAAISEAVETFIVPKMFGVVAQGDMTAEDAVRWAEKELKRIYTRWAGKGLV